MERLVYTFNRIFLGLCMETGVAIGPGLAIQLGMYSQNKVLSTGLCNSRACIAFLSDPGSTGSITTASSLSTLSVRRAGFRQWSSFSAGWKIMDMLLIRLSGWVAYSARIGISVWATWITA